MPRRRPKPLPTIWRAADDLWRVVESVLTVNVPDPRQVGIS